MATVPVPTPLRNAELIDQVETILRAKFHGTKGRLHFRLAEPVNHAVSGEWFVEALLEPAQRIDHALRVLTKVQASQPWSPEAEEQVHIVIDGIRDGKIGLAEFTKLAGEPDYKPGTPGYHLLFARNAHLMVEQLRTAIQRVFDRSDVVLAAIRELITNEGSMLHLTDELLNFSPTTGRVHAAFTEGVVAIATTLDLIYRVFVFLVREPFGTPDLPGFLHFPYHEPAKVYSPFPKGAHAIPTDLDAAALPFALPNLTAGSFFSLRGMRNDLTHNFTSGHVQPITWIGYGTPWVSNAPIRYVQFVAPDVDADGKAEKHPFVERFYTDQRDGASLFRALTEELALCADHTLRWLANRLEQRVRVAGL